MTPKEKKLIILYVVFLFLLSVGFICWGLNGGGYWPLIIGVFFVVSFIVNFFYVWYELKTGDHNNEDFGSLQCGTGCMLSVALVFLVAFLRLDDTRYITQKGNRLHIQNDCPSLQSCTDVREITKLEGWFHWTFQDCKVCTDIQEKQKEEQRKAEKLKQAESTRQELIEYYKEKVEFYQGKLDKLMNEDNPDEIFKEERIMEVNEYEEEEYDLDPGDFISNQ